ncbi:MAG: carbonate dehydratase [Myxococcales bacterium]|nr:carbonate dehydratase [Myxococcales bacterium]
MRTLPELFRSNRQWAERLKADDPGFFTRLSNQQSPEYLWIGCADSRVPANQIIDLQPGDVFVHRNVANQVIHADLNCLSVLQYAVEVLQVRHVIVCGHYGCGGVQAAFDDQRHGLVDNWLGHLRDVAEKYAPLMSALPPGVDRVDVLCELNVIEQVINVAHTTVVQDAWDRGQPLWIHGWIYALEDGLLNDLAICVDAETRPADARRAAVEACRGRPR